VKVLVSAYACEPGNGSEPGVGWNWVRQIACFHDIWVITRANNRQPIESALVKEPLPNAHFVYFDLPRWMRFWKKRKRGVHAYYYLWQAGAYFVARKLHHQMSFDLVHHVTFVNYWMPSFLALLPVPFLWGPVGGGESAPRSFMSTFSLRGKIYEVMRDLARAIAHFDPFVRLAARRAALAFSTTQATQNRLHALGCQKVLVLSEAGLTGEEIRNLGTASPRSNNHPFRLVSIGNLLHLKGFGLAMRAFAQFQSGFPASEYWLIGEGPERRRLERLAGELALNGKVTFWGRIPRTRVLEKLAECDVLVHPSLHDSGGWVCLEAMAAGCPVICLNLGGPAIQVTEETGIKVSAISPKQVVAELAAAMNQLASDPARRVKLGKSARERVGKHFAWERKGDFLMGIYSTIVPATGARKTC